MKKTALSNLVAAQFAAAAAASCLRPGGVMSHASMGFTYTVEHIRKGVVIDREVVHNIMPTQGLNLVQSILFKGTAVPATWYIGLFEANYTPLAADTAATFVASATECTTYDEATRVAFVPGTVSAGALDNSASRAEFTFNATKTVYGGFISSVATKSSTSGSLLSAVKFASPKAMADDDVLRVTAGHTFAST
jgi:hypothetical protein